MNERIKELAEQAYKEVIKNTPSFLVTKESYEQKFAELIVRECVNIARNWENELEKAKMPSESDAVGIATYRIARQFGVEE